MERLASKLKLSVVHSVVFTTNSHSFLSNKTPLNLPKPTSTRHPHFRISTFSVLKTPSSAVSEIVEDDVDDVLQEFFRDRQLNGDLVSKLTDLVFEKRVMQLYDGEATSIDGVAQNSESMENAALSNDEPEGGFLKLKKTQEWLLGEETSPPVNRKPTSKELQDRRERVRVLNSLKYEALKRELLFMTLGVGAACTGYCLLTLSIQAAVSYAVGVGFSCLYLQLLYRRVDSMSRDSVPQIFRQKKTKKIGIRSEDVKEFAERSVKGSGMALSSPRLVIPAAIYGLWALLHRNVASDILDFQIVPAMMGLFAYKAAALIEVYRENDDLQFIFPEDEENFSE